MNRIMLSNPVLSSSRQQMRTVTCWLAIMVCAALAAAEEGGEPYYNSDPTDPCTGAWVCVRKPQLVPPTISYSKDVWCYFDQVAITCDPPTWIPGLKRKANPNCAEERPVFQYGEVYAWQLYYDGPFNMDTGGTPTGLIAGGPGGSFTEAACFIDPTSVGKPPLPPVPPDGQGGGTVPPPQGAAGPTYRWQKLKVGPVVVMIDVPGRPMEYTPNLRDRTGNVYFSKGLTGVDLFHPPGSNGVCGLGAWMTMDGVGCGSTVPQFVGSEECSNIKRVFVDEVIEVEELGCLPDATPVSLCGKGWSKFYPRPLISAESCVDYVGPLEYIFEAEELRRDDTCTGGDPQALRKKKGACEVVGKWIEKKVNPIPYTAVDDSGQRIRRELCAGKYRLVFKWIATFASDCDCVGPLIGEEITTFTIRELPKPEATIDTIKVNVPDDTWKLKVVTKKPYDDCNDYDKANYRVRIKGKDVPGKTAGQYLLDDQGKPTLEMVKKVHLGETVVFDMKGITEEKLANTKEEDLYDVTWTVSIFDDTVCGYIDQKIEDVTIKLALDDLDADTDNTSDPLTTQKKPDRTKTEDITENPDNPEPGLILVVNHGFEEDGFGNGVNPREDWDRPGIKADDEDLSVGYLTVKGPASCTVVLTYDQSRLIVYRMDGGSPRAMDSGATQSVDPGDLELRLEGIAAGPDQSPTLIKAEFRPTGGTGRPATDVIKVTVVDLHIAVDRDRDDEGRVTIKGQDLTDQKHPFSFWFNNDREGRENEKLADLQPDKAHEDYESSSQWVERWRDLEDFSRMKVRARGLNQRLRTGACLAKLQWDERSGIVGQPRIKAFRHPRVEADPGYLFDYFKAGEVVSAPLIGEIKRGAPLIVDKAHFTSDGGFVAVPIVWECNGDGASRDLNLAGTPGGPGAETQGRLSIVLTMDGKNVAAYRHLHLRLADMRWYYEHWTAGDSYTTDDSWPRPVISKAADSPVDLAGTEPVGLWDPNLATPTPNRTRGKVLVFIHGWRMMTWERRAYAETLYKRLYINGFNGRMVLMSWPTEFHTETGVLFSPLNYDRSDFTARRAGYVVRGALNQIRDRLANDDAEEFSVCAHSMGNVVAAEALRLMKDGSVGGYFALNSAEAAGAFNPAVPGRSRAWSSAGDYVPDLYAHSEPLKRALVSRWEWMAVEEGTRNRAEENAVDGLGKELGLTRLFGGDHGPALHAKARSVARRRISMYNGGDSATTGPWTANQAMKPDESMAYRAFRQGDIDLADGSRPVYIDWYMAGGSMALRLNSCLAEIGASPLPLNGDFPGAEHLSPWILSPARRIQWCREAGTEEEQIRHAAILAFIAKPRGPAVGAAPPSSMFIQGNAPGAGAPFTEGIDIDKRYGGDDDHSRLFNAAMSERSDGPVKLRKAYQNIIERL